MNLAEGCRASAGWTIRTIRLRRRCRGDSRRPSPRGTAPAPAPSSDPGLADARPCATHLTPEFAAVFSGLFDPTLDATNWRAEHAWPPAGVTRTACGGSHRTTRGAQPQQVLASGLRTAHPRGRDTTHVIAPLLRAPTPVLPAAFQGLAP